MEFCSANKNVSTATWLSLHGKIYHSITINNLSNRSLRHGCVVCNACNNTGRSECNSCEGTGLASACGFPGCTECYKYACDECNGFGNKCPHQHLYSDAKVFDTKLILTNKRVSMLQQSSLLVLKNGKGSKAGTPIRIVFGTPYDDAIVFSSAQLRAAVARHVCKDHKQPKQWEAIYKLLLTEMPNKSRKDSFLKLVTKEM